MIFLANNGMVQPSEVRERLHEFNHNRLVYMLGYVATPEHLDFVSFESTDDVENERIDILELLDEIDAENTKEYERERSQLSMQQVNSAVRYAR